MTITYGLTVDVDRVIPSRTRGARRRHTPHSWCSRRVDAVKTRRIAVASLLTADALRTSTLVPPVEGEHARKSRIKREITIRVLLTWLVVKRVGPLCRRAHGRRKPRLTDATAVGGATIGIRGADVKRARALVFHAALGNTIRTILAATVPHGRLILYVVPAGASVVTGWVTAEAGHAPFRRVTSKPGKTLSTNGVAVVSYARLIPSDRACDVWVRAAVESYGT